MPEPDQLEEMKTQMAKEREQTAKAIEMMELLAIQNKKNEAYTRKLKIKSEIAGFSSPADKRAVEFLMDFKFDCEDFEAIFQPILYKDMDGNIKVKAGVHNMAQEVDKIFKSCLKFGNMWSRKIRAELESYHVANKSAHKWGTEKLWRDEDYFVKQHDEGANWWEGAEKTPAEKAKKLREAEREARFIYKKKAGSNFRNSGTGAKKFRSVGRSSRFSGAQNYGGGTGGHASNYNNQMNFPYNYPGAGPVNFLPPQFSFPPQPPAPAKFEGRCYKCGLNGHKAHMCQSQK